MGQGGYWEKLSVMCFVAIWNTKTIEFIHFLQNWHIGIHTNPFEGPLWRIDLGFLEL